MYVQLLGNGRVCSNDGHSLDNLARCHIFLTKDISFFLQNSKMLQKLKFATFLIAKKVKRFCIN